MDKEAKLTASFITAVTAAMAILSLIRFGDAWWVCLLAVIIYAAIMPLSLAGIYLWGTGRGSNWLNGPDWSKMTEDHTRFVCSKTGLGLAVGSNIILYSLVAMNLPFPFGLILCISLITAGAVIIIVPVVRYSNIGRYGNVKPVLPGRKRMWTAMAVCTLVATVPSFMIIDGAERTGDIVVTLGDTSLTVKAPYVSEEIQYSDITDRSLKEDFHRGSRIQGYNGSEMQTGQYKNSEFGIYTLATYKSCRECIAITVGGDTVVFNQKTAEGTDALYSELVSHI